MSICEWVVGDVNKDKIREYSEILNIPQFCLSILYARGFRKPETISEFLDSDSVINPFQFTDMQKAVECLELSIKNKEKICIYGDYDADGITSTALMYSYLKSCNADVICYIPSREEGYGLNCSAIKNLSEQDINLIITVDNGVSAYEEIKFANSLGIKVLVTDHHKIPEKLPPAEAIINPCREKWDTNFAGVGVVYKFIEAIESAKDIKIANNDYLSLVAIGTIGDAIQLYGESRNLVKRGLECINNSNIKGINLFLEALGLKYINSTDLAFKIVPRINASGRIEHANLALRLLIENNEEECIKICQSLENLNILRKKIEEEIMQSVEEQLLNYPYKKYEKIIILKGKNWHHGVLGIVAAKVVQKYNKPCILISYSDNGEARGSCRSVEGFSIYDIILSCSEYLERFGGHPMAAGINLKTENIDKFINAVIEKSKEVNIDFQKLSVDLELEPSSLTLDNLYSLNYLEPFGNGNPEPMFSLTNLKLEKIYSIGQGNHLKLTFCKDNKKIEVLYFNKKRHEFLYQEGDILDIVFTMHENIYKLKSSLSIYITDLRLSNSDVPKVLEHKKIYEKFKRNEILNLKEIESILPSREEFVKVYRYLKLLKNRFSRIDVLSNRIFNDYENSGKLYIILDVFENLGLINIFWSGDDFTLDIKNSSKVDLESSEILKALNQMKEGIIYG